MFPEALMLHYLDDLDSKMESMRAHFERELGSEGPWSSYNPSLGRPLLNTSKFIAKKPVAAPAPHSPETALQELEPAPVAVSTAGDSGEI
jgi:3'-5' exoribonuclease